MSARTIFVTGTDTGVGKTYVSCALLGQARKQGMKVCGYKPVASGCEPTPGGLRNDDALALQKSAGTREPYESINPYAFAPAIAPHLAARAAGTRIKITQLNAVHAELAGRYELVVVEGAGGWQVPLNDDLSFAGWIAQRNWPVLLVVGMRLGCINHALLSAESISRRTRLAGWVANVLPPEMTMLEENIATLREHLAAPQLGVMPANGEAQLDLQTLLAAFTDSPESPETPGAEES
ncbi:MAG: dethiobiotin synthase [Stenotrophobium sp.]